MILKGAGLRFEIEGEEAGKKFAEWANNACCDANAKESAVSQQAAQEEKIQSPSSQQPKLEPYIFRLTPFLIIFSARILFCGRFSSTPPLLIPLSAANVLLQFQHSPR